MKKSTTSREYYFLLEILIDLRQKNKLSKADLARKLNVDNAFISAYESGSRRLDFIEVYYICEALEYSLKKLVEDFNNKMDRT